MATKGWKMVQSHVPMIKFRKGGINKVVAKLTKPAPSASGTAASRKPEGATGPNVVVLPLIDDYQLPVRFQRRPIDSNEMDYINRGGPE